MKKIELLSPVGDIECLRAAVQNGADAVYLGASLFNARARAANFDDENLKKAIEYAKSRNVKVNLTLNILIKNEEFLEAAKLAVKAYNYGVDAIIIQDLGLAKYLRENYPQIPLHASTQMTIHNLEGAKLLKEQGYARVVLARELTIDEIKYIKDNLDVELEVFGHGALCISYSGQCLLSSMIGGRSGNRGLCAQPCRKRYELIDKTSNKSLDKGFLLSPRDLYTINLLPELIKECRVDSLKLEGRLKSPIYVSTITRIYRKYIDLVENNIEKSIPELKKLIEEELKKVNPDTNLTDKEELEQVFNRGKFSSGHLLKEENRDLIYPVKSNNQGIYLGEILSTNESKGHIEITLSENAYIGDKLSIGEDIYQISELMKRGSNIPFGAKGDTVTLGRMKGPNVKKGFKVYKLESAYLNKKVEPTFKEDSNLKQVPLDISLEIHLGKVIKATISSNTTFYKDLNYEYLSDVIPEEAKSSPVSKEVIIDSLNKTGNTEFYFENIDINMDDNIFIPKSRLNDLRRTLLEDFRQKMMDKYTFDLDFKDNIHFEKYEKAHEKKKISLLLNIINQNINYLEIDSIDRLYIPLRFFIDKKYNDTIKNLSVKYDVYIYMPSVLKDTPLNIKLEELLDKVVPFYSIKGFIVSNISQVNLLKKFGLKLIGNFTLNIFNNYTTDYLKELSLDEITYSPETSSLENNELYDGHNMKTELIVYGKIPVMTNNYCYLGKSNKCYESCPRLCSKNHEYYLKDELGYSFRIVPDNTCTLTTIYNSKITSIEYNNIKTDSVRIDILDESLEEIKEIIDRVKQGKRFEGKDYTNGKAAAM